MQGGPGHGGDKEWFTIDKTNGVGHGFQYQFWTGFFACDSGEFTRSTDGGLTWMTPINIPNSAQTGALDVDTNGNLFVGGTDWRRIQCLRSSNAQIGTQTPTFDRNHHGQPWRQPRSGRHKWNRTLRADVCGSGPFRVS